MELDLNNKTFGYWDVIEKDVELSKAKNISYWKCKCQLCGQVYSVRGTALNTGKSTKCSHCSSRVINEIGNVYNNLTVVQSAGRKNNRAMWKCKCSCGNYIEVSGTDLRNEYVKSCGRCPGKESLGERFIRQFLIDSKIEFIQEHYFDDFIYENGHHPRFDFYIPSRNYIIEFDGKQHFTYQNNTSLWNNEENYIKTIENDNIKNEYCFAHHIPIIRIPYFAKDITIFDLIPETSRFTIRKDEFI